MAQWLVIQAFPYRKQGKLAINEANRLPCKRRCHHLQCAPAEAHNRKLQAPAKLIIKCFFHAALLLLLFSRNFFLVMPKNQTSILPSLLPRSSLE